MSISLPDFVIISIDSARASFLIIFLKLDDFSDLVGILYFPREGYQIIGQFLR